MTWRAFRDSRAYDLLMALPLILWFGGAALRLRPALVSLGAALLRGEVTGHGALLFLALFASATFNLLLVWLLIARTPPVRRAGGLMPRLAGFAGAFISVGILYLPRAPVELGWVVVSDMLSIFGMGASVLVVSRLGRSFAIMPEARVLVTTGAYAWVRHPLYVTEIVAMLGNAILFEQPWAGLLAIAAMALQVMRARHEEKVLLEAFADYAAYRARTPMFIPGVI